MRTAVIGLTFLLLLMAAPATALTLADLTVGTPYAAGSVTFTFRHFSSLFQFQPGQGLHTTPIEFFDGGFVLPRVFEVSGKAESAGAMITFVVDAGIPVAFGDAVNDEPLAWAGAGIFTSGFVDEQPIYNLMAQAQHTICSGFFGSQTCLRGHATLTNPGVRVYTQASLVSVPEPSVLVLLAAGVVVVVVVAVRHRAPLRCGRGT